MLNSLILNRIYRYGANDRKALSPVHSHSLSTNVTQQCLSTETHIPENLPHFMSKITGEVKNWKQTNEQTETGMPSIKKSGIIMKMKRC